MAIDSQDKALGRFDNSVIPGPKGLPVLGSAIAMRRDLLSFMHRGLLEYGDVVRASAGSGRFRVDVFGVFHPDGVQQVLASNADNYSKGDDVYGELRNLLGNGLLTSEGDTWKRQKRMVQPLFTHKRVAAYVPMMADEANQLIARWRPAVLAGQSVDLHGEMTRITLRVVGRAVFGTEVEHMLPVFKDTVPYLSRWAFERGILPVTVPEDWPIPSNRKARRYKDTIYATVTDLITQRRAAGDGGEDLINLLIRAQDPEHGEDVLSDEEVRDQALVFLMAGHETTATSLTFALHLLGHHPEAQRRVREEVAEVLGDREPTLEDVKALAYTTMAVKEAMRLYPAAHNIPRSARHEDEISGYRIAAGSPVVVSPWVTHRHPRFWDSPEAFKPERFLPAAEAARHRYAYFPFGGGPRACIGSYFSMLEAVIVTALTVRAYDITTQPGRVPLFTGITLRPERAMPAQLSPRRTAA